jgi:hypothetical protein
MTEPAKSLDAAAGYVRVDIDNDFQVRKLPHLWGHWSRVVAGASSGGLAPARG